MLDMGIVKIEIKLPELTQSIQQFKNNRIHALEKLTHDFKSAISRTFNQLLQTEMTLFLGKPDESLNKRNGYYERDYALKGIGCLRIRMPRDRDGRFDSDILPVHERIDPRLKEDIAVLHLAGLSNRTLSFISRRILGVSVSPDTVMRSLIQVEDKALMWLTRPLEKDYWALFVDGTNFRIQRSGSTEKEPALVVLGLDTQNRMSILAIEPGRKDSAECWSAVFGDLKRRGLKPDEVQIGIMDGLPGLEKVFGEHFDHAVAARCWVHALRNAMAKVPDRYAEAFKGMAHEVMYAESESDGSKAFERLKQVFGRDAERAVVCLEKDLEALLAHYRFDRRLWRTLRSTNPIERVNKELKRRTKSMESLGEKTLRVVTAFIALRLEYHWQRLSVDLPHLEMKQVRKNTVELAVKSLIH